MKTISITVDDRLLRSVDQAAAALKRTRSELCRLALGHWLASARHGELMRADREAYRDRPVTPDEFEGLLQSQASFEDEARRQ